MIFLPSNKLELGDRACYQIGLAKEYFIRFLPFLLIGVFLQLSIASFGQRRDQNNILFQNGPSLFPENFSQIVNENDLEGTAPVSGYYFRYIQFEDQINKSLKSEIQDLGILFIEYIPHKAYLIAIPENLSLKQLEGYNVRTIFDITELQKIDGFIASGNYPKWALNNGLVSVMIRTYDIIPPSVFEAQVKLIFPNLAKDDIHFPYYMTNISPDQVSSLTALPFVKYIEVGASPAIPEDINGINLQRSNQLQQLAFGGTGLNGKGVNVLVRDQGIIGPHIDFQGRLVNMIPNDNVNQHSDAVSGVFAGAGNVNPMVEAPASGSILYLIEYTSTLLDNVEALHLNDDVMITNSSFSNGCNAGYTSTTQRVDKQVVNNPSLLHVFSAGNANGSDCGYGAGTQWGNITGGHKVAKNVVTVANLNARGELNATSSRGPAHDGRIKPDLAAHGEDQLSTAPNHSYDNFGGTSSAAPTAAAAFAQLYQGYKNLNGQLNPDAGLIKASILNTCKDLGNEGPDFKYGWGLVDAKKAYDILVDTTYVVDSIAHGSTNSISVAIPANVKEARVMLYWSDPEGAVNASKALVNDLDLTVLDPNAVVNFPLVLDISPDPVSLNLPATNGVDTLNNVEQVRLIDPVAGNYELQVAGTDVPLSDQKYSIVWSFILDTIELTFPLVGDALIPGDTTLIHWDALNNSESFVLEYSLDNGANWILIENNIPDTFCNYPWVVPDTFFTESLIRLTRGNSSDVSGSFTILDRPQFSIVDTCIGSVFLNWNAVDGADNYTIFQLGDQYMDSIGTTTDTSFQIFGLPVNEEAWFSVAAQRNGKQGIRANALSEFISNSNTCPIADLRITEISSPVNTSRVCGASAFSMNESISIEIENIGTTPLDSITIFYSIDDGAPTNELLPTVISGGTTETFTFSGMIDLSANTEYDLKVWIAHEDDVISENDTLIKKIIALDNPPVNLPFTEDFESLLDQDINTNQSGFCNLNRLDFETDNPTRGRLRTRADIGFPKSGERALTMDMNGPPLSTINFSILTFNLSNHLADDLRMDFAFMHHGDSNDANDKVWIRGSDVDAWLEIYDIGANLGGSGNYKMVNNLDVSTILDNGGQTPSCTFQIRFGQEDDDGAVHIEANGGITIDDVTLRVECRMRPTVSCQPATVILDEFGTASFDVSQVDNGSSGCPPFTFSISGQSVINYTCADLGNQNVSVEVTDINGASGSCNTTITIVDQTGPSMTCTNKPVLLDSFGIFPISIDDVFLHGNDNCSSLSNISFTTDTLNCSDIGSTIAVEVTAQDDLGNQGSCMAQLTVQIGDAGAALCKESFVSLDSITGLYILQESDVFDNTMVLCDSISILSFTPDTIRCSSELPLLVDVMAEDNLGNTFNCTSLIQINNPEVCPSFTNCTIDTIFVNNQLIIDTQLQMFKASSTIQSDAQLDLFNSFLFQGSDAIEFMTDFEVPSAILFEGVIGPCE